MKLAKKIALSLLIVAVIGAVAGIGSYSAFTGTTANSGNVITSGTVVIGDDDSAQALYTGTNLKPGDSYTKCITLTYTGSLDADVKLYTASSIGSLGSYIDLDIWYGSGGSYADCTGFTSQAQIFNNTLANFATNHSSWSNGLTVYPGDAAAYWAGGGSTTGTFKFTVTVADNNAAQGTSTGSHAFTWEAQNR